MIDEKYYELAKYSANRANSLGGASNIRPEWVYCQWVHETGGFTSELCVTYNNLGGLTQSEDNGLPQPDGDQYYMQFKNPEAYAHYFGWYIAQFAENGIFEAQSLEEYVTSLKNGGYFSDDLQNYLNGTYAVLNSDFPGMA